MTTDRISPSSDTGPASLADLVPGHAQRTPDRVLMSRRGSSGWELVTAAAFSEQVTAVALGLLAAGLEPGDRVLHDSFGLGTVVSMEGAAEKSVASIDFGSDGVKRLLLRYAPVEKL